jgi:hypothetical protein
MRRRKRWHKGIMEPDAFSESVSTGFSWSGPSDSVVSHTEGSGWSLCGRTHDVRSISGNSSGSRIYPPRPEDSYLGDQ